MVHPQAGLTRNNRHKRLAACQLLFEYRTINTSFMTMRALVFLLIFCQSGFSIEFHENDRIALIGNTVIERAQKYGHIETSLTLAINKSGLQFRNLGWSGDSVFCHARSYFGPPQEGFDRLENQLSELKPHIILICYGSMAAFDGSKGIADFIQGYERLLEMIVKSANPREIILISPPPAENLGPPMPDLTNYNQNLNRYREAIGQLAKKNHYHFSDLFGAITPKPTPQTENGIHYSDQGYQTLAQALTKTLGLTPAPTTLLNSEETVHLRHAIIKKNKLFFFQWRPANETYLRLFRKHEQGQNAKELSQFDPLILEAEREIERLRTNNIQTGQ